MTFWESMDRRAKRLGIVDTKLAQTAAIFFALVVVKLVPQVLSVSLWWFAGLAAASAVKPILTFYGRSDDSPSSLEA